MKTILKVMLLIGCLAGFASCEKKDLSEPTDQIIVSYKTIDGAWQLSNWNGSELPNGQYCYLVLNRNEHTFVMYQNFDSQYSRSISGSFFLGKDDDGRDYISGNYDFNNGDWNDDYYLTMFGGQNARMEWVASENSSDVQIFVPCDEVPAEIVKGTKSEVKD